MHGSSLIEIDRLNLHLPVGFEFRAGAIARETVHQLSRMAVGSSGSWDTLSLQPITAGTQETNQVIAQRIAKAIHRQIAAAPGPGATHVD